MHAWFFHPINGEKIKAVYPKQGYAVMVFFEESPIDTDFNEKVWVPSEEELMEIRRKLDESDRKSYELLGRGWNGKRPYWKLQDFM